MLIERTVIIVLLVFCISSSWAQNALNVELFGQFNRGDERYSGSWSYIDAQGREYAILGTRTGTAVYAIDDEIEELGFIPGPESNWREIMVLGNHAFVTTEGASDTTGMQVIALDDLPNSIALVTTYSETFDRGHILQRDIYSDAPYIYVNGTISTQGIHILDVSDPANPLEVGLYNPGYYIHDCHVKGDLIFASAFYESTIDVIDVSDKSNPVLITRINDPGGATHSAWLTEDDQYLMVCSEQDGLPARMYNVGELNNAEPIAQYTANRLSLVHNPYIRGKYSFVSHNTEGLRVVDLYDPEVPVEVGYYDTFLGPSGGFFGLWSACPFYPSGKIIGGDRTEGLYVWTFNETRAGRIYGTIVDGLTQMPLSQGEVIVEMIDTVAADFNGQVRWGGVADTYQLLVKAPGYFDEVYNVSLNEGDSLNQVFELLPLAIGTKELGQKEIPALHLSPNPAQTQARVDLEDYSQANQLVVYDLQGSLIATYSIAQAQQINLTKEQLGTGGFQLLLRDASGQILGAGRLLFY